ncbi:hypothetical protein [Rhizocola hellebori]|uniref:hypothetical protein n=1 Tax=Rhizocola hellebori TaxID=1392758 RepID=UPI0019446F5D|nr:hypothetical protein [Rhizocola hellebori]
MAAAMVMLPGRWAAVLAAVAYAALACIAYGMRGQRCACFGATALATVSWVHIGANTAGALASVGVAALARTDGGQPAPRVAVALLAAVATWGILLAAGHRRRNTRAIPSACAERISGVHLFISEDCPSCRSLSYLLSMMEAARLSAVTTTVIEAEREMPQALHGLGVPSALPLDAAGNPICSPVSGIGAVKMLINSITIGAPVGDRGR